MTMMRVPVANICNDMIFEMFNRVLQLGIQDPVGSDKQSC